MAEKSEDTQLIKEELQIEEIKDFSDNPKDFLKTPKEKSTDDVIPKEEPMDDVLSKSEILSMIKKEAVHVGSGTEDKVDDFTLSIDQIKNEILIDEVNCKMESDAAERSCESNAKLKEENVCDGEMLDCSDLVKQEEVIIKDEDKQNSILYLGIGRNQIPFQYKMFAVVEFNNKKNEFSIVPLAWLSENKLSCLWPRNVCSDKQLRDLVEQIRQPKPSWKSHAVKRILKTTETYAEANIALELILAEKKSNNSDVVEEKSSENTIHKTAQELEVENEEVYAPENEKQNNSELESETEPPKETRKKKTAKKRKIQNEYTSDSDDHSALLIHPRKKGKKLVSTFNFTSESEEEVAGNQFENANNTPRLENIGDNVNTSVINCTDSQIPSDGRLPYTQKLTVNDSLRQIGSCGLVGSSRSPSVSRQGPSAPNRTSQQLSQWQQNITDDLERIKAVQEQQSTLLLQIWQAIQAKNIQALQRPPDIPSLPLERSKDFAHFEIWLENENNFVYMRTRLASIGGTTVRAAVLNMMKFVMSNRLGMAFSWAGTAPKSPHQRKKYAFKETLTYKAINEAAILCFQGQEKSLSLIGELTDRAIGLACQDWLKQAKHRFQNSK